MSQAVRVFGEFFGEKPYKAAIEHYRCSECSVNFEIEHTVVGPRCCPACGVIYDVARDLQVEQLAHLALALNMSPTTLLWTLRLIAAAVNG